MPLASRCELSINASRSGTSACRKARRKLGMKKKAVNPLVWIKPEIRRLGAITDVAGAQGPGTQGNSAKT